MTAPALAVEIRGKGRHYTTPDGRAVPSVTNILGVFDKSAPLMWWAAERVVTAIASQPERFAADCADDLPAAVKKWKGVWRQERDDAAERGTTIHQWLQAAIEGDPVGPLEALMDPDTARFLTGARLFMEEQQPTGACEVTRIAHTYGGTADLLGKLSATGDRLVVADWKTRANGKHDVYDSEVMQLAALRYAATSAVPSDEGPKFIPSFTAEGAVLVTFTPTSYRLHDLSDRAGREAWDAFDGLRIVREWMLAAKGNGRG